MNLHLMKIVMFLCFLFKYVFPLVTLRIGPLDFARIQIYILLHFILPSLIYFYVFACYTYIPVHISIYIVTRCQQYLS